MQDYYDLISWTASIVTLLFQLYTFYLITFHSDQEMREYAYFLKLLVVGVCNQETNKVHDALGI